MSKRLRILAGPNGSGKSSVYEALIFDNSESSHKWIAEYDGVTGELTYKEDEIPQWVEQYV